MLNFLKLLLLSILMSLDLFLPENETEEYAILFTKNCSTLIEQTHTKLQKKH